MATSSAGFGFGIYKKHLYKKVDRYIKEATTD